MAKLIWSEKSSGQKQASHDMVAKEHLDRANKMALLTFERNALLAITGIIVIVFIITLWSTYG